MCLYFLFSVSKYTVSQHTILLETVLVTFQCQVEAYSIRWWCKLFDYFLIIVRYDKFSLLIPNFSLIDKLVNKLSL